jgi:hypothetical protein
MYSRWILLLLLLLLFNGYFFQLFFSQLAHSISTLLPSPFLAPPLAGRAGEARGGPGGHGGAADGAAAQHPEPQAAAAWRGRGRGRGWGGGREELPERPAPPAVQHLGTAAKICDSRRWWGWWFQQFFPKPKPKVVYIRSLVV